MIQVFPLTNNLDCISNLRHLLNNLGTDKFRQLVSHVVVGDQIICRAEWPEVIREFIDSLRFLIPFGCAKTIYWSNGYEESYKCNLLGLTADVKIPDRLVKSGHVILIRAIRNGQTEVI